MKKAGFLMTRLILCFNGDIKHDFKDLYRKNYKNKCTFQNADSAEEKRDVIFTKLLAGYVSDDKISVVACVACPSLNPEDVEHTTETVKTVFPAGNKT